MCLHFTWGFEFYKPCRIVQTVVWQVAVFCRMQSSWGNTRIQVYVKRQDSRCHLSRSNDFFTQRYGIFHRCLQTLPLSPMLVWFFLELCGDAKCSLWKRAWEKIWQPVTVSDWNKAFGTVTDGYWQKLGIVTKLCNIIQQAMRHLVPVISN